MSEASNSHSSNMLNDSEAVSISGKIMVGSIMVLFFVVVFVFLLHVFAKRFRDRQTNGRRFVFTPTPRDSHITTAARLRRGVGLEPSVIQSLPIQVFQRTEFVDGLECAVCLSELSDGDKARLLPKCNHGFHIDCIDVWFQSHSTCPLCRSPVAPESSNPVSDLPPENILISITATDDSSTTESRSIPPNILFWGDETQVRNSGSYTEDGPSSSSYSSSSSTLPPAISRQGVEKLVIEIPEQLSEAFSSMSPTAEEFKSPMATRLRSLKRLLSGKKRVIPCGPSSTGDVEHSEPVKGSEGSDS